MKTRFLFLVFLIMSSIPCRAKDSLITFEASDLPASGCLVVKADYTSLLRWQGIDPGKFAGVEYLLEGKPFPAQFIPTDSPEKGLVALKFSPRLVEESKSRNIVLCLRFKRADANTPPVKYESPVRDSVQIVRPEYRVSMKCSIGGGFPEKIEFVRSGKVYDNLRWYDRLYHKEISGWNLYNDKEAELAILSDGPVCTAVRLSSRFKRADGATPASKPRAVYHWLFFKGAGPFIYVTADYKQETPFTWQELHFLEFRPNGQFSHWSAANQEKSTPFSGTDQSVRDKKACAVSTGNDYVALFGNSAGIYDGKSKTASYIMGDMNFAWKQWDNTETQNAGWIQIGHWDANTSPGEQLTAAADSLSSGYSALVMQTSQVDQDKWLDLAATAGMINGSFPNVAEAKTVQALTPFVPQEKYFAFESNDLGLVFARQKNERGLGLRLISLVDRRKGRSLTASEPSALFSLNLRDLTSKEKGTLPLIASDCWKKIDIQADRATRSCRMTFSEPTSVAPEEAAKIAAVVSCVAGKEKGIEFTLEFKSDSNRYSLMNAIFPSVRLRSLGRTMNAFYPTGPGLVIANPIEKGCNRSSWYPTGFGASMAWMAAWDRSAGTGLYFGFHDAWGTPKTVRLQSNPARDSLLMEYDHPIPNMTQPANSCKVSGSAHLQALHGDWYDAACIYRQWVRAHAKWYPQLGPEGRPDTPDWMKKLSLWCITDGGVATMPERMKEFKEAFGVPAACHWYNWHQIPFDNDYPHFLPSRDGFKDAVLEIQKEGDFAVMPYINGRLWDTHDKGMEDWQFTKVAQSAVSKLEDGSPRVETYSSKEKDGKKVVLGVMCPYTKLWQDKQRELVLRLMNEEHVLAVYLDQISASRTTLCMDPAHGHPLGGGCWWLTGYWTMLQRIRTDMKQSVADFPLSPEEKRILAERPDHLKNRMLTSECNAETYAHVLDGFLTWHWQYQNAVPAFSTVYCGVIQMFGRSYNGSPAAWRMKAAESLAFGEQIGWFSDVVLTKPECFDFIRQAVRFRFHRVEYFYKGEMARPVTWMDPMPPMTDDWKWSGQKTTITADAVRTGTWRILDFADAQKGKTTVNSVLIAFANASDHEVKARVAVDLAELGFKEGEFELYRVDAEGKTTRLDPSVLKNAITYPARTVFGLEFRRK